MPIKGLTPLEQAVLADAPTAIERELAAEAKACDLEQKARVRSAAIAAGWQRDNRASTWASSR